MRIGQDSFQPEELAAFRAAVAPQMTQRFAVHRRRGTTDAHGAPTGGLTQVAADVAGALVSAPWRMEERTGAAGLVPRQRYRLWLPRDTDLRAMDVVTLHGTFRMTLGTPTSGTYRLSMEGAAWTTALGIVATAAQIQGALASLVAIAEGNVSVAGPIGGPFRVRLLRALAASTATPVADEATGSYLTGPIAFTKPAFEVVDVAMELADEGWMIAEAVRRWR